MEKDGKLSENYNRLVKKYHLQVQMYDNEFDGKFLEIDNIVNHYNGLIESLVEIREDYVKKAKLDLKDIKSRHMALMEGNLKEIEKFSDIINVLNGRSYRPVHRIEKENMNVRNPNPAIKVQYFDELYDSEALSLRAVILGKNKSKNFHVATNEAYPAPYSLMIIGFAEYGSYKKNKSITEIELVGMEKFFNVQCKVMENFNLQRLIAFYENNIKDFNGELNPNLFKKERKDVEKTNEFLKDVVEKEERQHEFKEFVLKNYSRKDVEDMLGAICPECEMDFLTTEQVDNAQNFKLICWHCGMKLKKIN